MPYRVNIWSLDKRREAHWDGELVLIGSVDVVGPAALHHVTVDGLIHKAWQEGGEGLLGVAVHGPEVQHLGSVQRMGQLLKCPEAAPENPLSMVGSVLQQVKSLAFPHSISSLRRTLRFAET